MSIKSRLVKIEARRAAKSIQAFDCPNMRKWLNDTITAINNGTAKPSKPRGPLSKNAGLTGRWLDEILNKIEAQS
jgi:hypothetical protein